MTLSIENITKQFKDKRAVDDVSLELTPGVWGLLGANGAGKTTLMRMLVGIMQPTSGEIRFDGVAIGQLGEAYRDRIGYLPQEFGFYPSFTVGDYLDYMAALKGLDKADAHRRIDALLERLTLADVRKKRIAKLSGGMKRRVGIAQALLNEPEILILDEPTSGLDPSERVRFRNLLSEFAQGRIVLISTHIVSDVEYIAAHNAIMKDGRLIGVGSTQELVQEVRGKVWTATIAPSQLAAAERALSIVNLKNEDDGSITLRYLADEAALADSRTAEPRLEDLFLWRFPHLRHDNHEGM
ncbi:MAG: ABC transporter ATP-binding protein [Peptococcaceae bacterium]|nr:ABC transporter ATP-binding protein [Peptococcaceae bacterium]